MLLHAFLSIIRSKGSCLNTKSLENILSDPASVNVMEKLCNCYFCIFTSFKLNGIEIANKTVQ